MKNSSITFVSEPAVAYNKTDQRYHQLQVVLGGATQPITSEIDLISLTRAGLEKSSLDIIAKRLGVSLEVLSSLLHISYRTILRKEQDDRLNAHISEQVIAFAEVIRRGTEVFDSEDNLRTWLHTALPALDHGKPIDFLDTSFGINMILRILGRIEHGIY